jgi:hypothetical protein
VYPKDLVGVSFKVEGEKSSITLPDSILEGTGLSNDDDNTLVDVALKRYPNYEGPEGAKSAVIDFTLYQSGKRNGYDTTNDSRPTEIMVTNAKENITVTIEASGMHDDFAPDCVYAKKTSKKTGKTEWSTDGCVLDTVDR